MKKTAFKALELTINRYLNLDCNQEQQATYFNKLNNKTIAFHLKHPAVSILFSFKENHVNILSENTKEPIDIDAHIYTSLFQLTRLKFKKQKSLVGSGFHLKGDIDLIKNLNHLFEQHQIDWEEHISKFTGDVLAYKAGKIFNKKKSYVQKKRHDFIDNMSEYLQEEKELLPHPLAVENFNKNLDELKLQVDRIQARLTHINKQLLETGDKSDS